MPSWVHGFFSSDAIEFAGSVDRPSIFTKCLCFAVLQYLAPERVTEVLRILWDRFTNVHRVVLGNLPNREKANLFFSDGYDESDLQRHQSQMPDDIFNAKYRFDAILTRRVNS